MKELDFEKLVGDFAKNEAKEISIAEVTVRKFLINVPFWYSFWSLNKLQNANQKRYSGT